MLIRVCIESCRRSRSAVRMRQASTSFIPWRGCAFMPSPASRTTGLVGRQKRDSPNGWRTSSGLGANCGAIRSSTIRLNRITSPSFQFSLPRRSRSTASWLSRAGSIRSRSKRAFSSSNLFRLSTSEARTAGSLAASDGSIFLVIFLRSPPNASTKPGISAISEGWIFCR